LFFGGKDTTLQTGVIGGHFYFKGGNVNGFGQSNFSIADYNGSNTRFFVSGSGNVGIGTTTPSENLQVSGSILVGQYASSTSLLKFANVTNAGNSAYIGQTAAAGFEIQPGSVNEFRINTPAGTDTAALTIFGNGVKTAQFYRNSRTRFGGNLSTNPGSTVEIVGEGATSATTALRVQNSSATPSLVVLDNGFVGIGTGSADFNLDVNGSTRVKGAGATGSTNAFVVQNSAGNNALIVTNGLTTNVQGDLQLENSVLYWNAGSQIRNISNGVLRITNSSNSDFTRLQFGGGTTAFPALQRVSASIAIVDATGGTSGSLLVGTITDAGYKLDVNGTTRVSGLLTLSAGASITGNVSIGSANFISAARYQCSTSLFNFGTTFLYGAGGQDGGTITTGSRTIFLSDANWTQSSGNADFSSFRVTGTINQTGTADGITRGLYIAPTLTAAANFRAIETTAGNVLFQSGSTSLMTVSSSGNVTIPSNLSVGLTDTYGRFNLRGSDNLGATRTMTVQSADQTLLFQMYNNGTTMLNPQGAGTVLVGTSVASGANLQVRGKGATSATTALRVENTNATASLVVRDDGSTLFAGSNGVAGTWVDDTGSLTIYRSNFGTIYGLKVYNGAGWIGHNAIHAIAYQYPIYGLQGSNGAEFASPLNAGAGVYGRGGVGVYGNGVTPAGDSGSIGVMATSLYVQSAGNTALYNRSASAHIIGTSIFSGNMTVTGSVRISGSSALTVIGSGSALPIFTVQGSQGELFSIVDSLSGSLFSVNDISGLPILEVFSDGTTLIGDYQDPALITTTKKTANTGITTIYSLPTASYDSAWFDYTIRSGSDARVGTIMGMWSGTSVNYAETSASQFGNTGGFTFGMSISGSNMILSGSATTSGWTVKTIIRSI
jgi:hypothetical protein